MSGLNAVHIFEIIEYITFFYICMTDIKKKIIPDSGFIILVIKEKKGGVLWKICL